MPAITGTTTPFNYRITFDDGTTQNVRIRLKFHDACDYYLHQTFTYWNNATQREDSRTVTMLECVLRVKRIDDDGWSRPRLRNIDNRETYVDISLGNARHGTSAHNLPGDWHSVSGGEPLSQLPPFIHFDERPA